VAQSGLLGQQGDLVSRRITFRTLSAAGCVALATIASPASALTVDPGVTPAVAGTAADSAHTVTLDLVGDTWVSSSGQTTTSQAASPELRVGARTFGGAKSRTYLDFDYSALGDIPAGAVITSAELDLSNFASGSCSGAPLRAARVTGAWTLDGLTWANQPAATTAGWGTSTASFGAAACPAEGLATFDVKGIVNAWISGEARRGILVKVDQESGVASNRTFRSAENSDTAKAPTLTISYDAPPAVPTDLTVTPGANGYATSLTPTLGATVSDPDGTVSGYFEVRKGTTASSPVVWSGTSDPVDSGDEATVTVPGGVLLDGTLYSVWVRGDDGIMRSNPAATAFKTDVTAPDVVVTSNVFTDGQWKTVMPTSATFTLNGSSDVGGFHLTTDGTAYDVGANLSGDKSITIKPTPGWHVLEVTPVDRAGNVGDTVTFSWGTGAPEFTTPAFWQTSTADFAVDISAPAGATGATLQWQVPGEATWHTATHLVRGVAAWDGSLITDQGRSTTGPLTWHATAETLGSGTLAAPALVRIHGCFHYAGSADKCTADRFVQLVEE
jgi:hypothetical protein